MKFFNIFLILACSFLFAGELNLKQIQKKPKSIARDYYIYRALKNKNTNQNDIEKMYKLVKRMSPTLKDLFHQKLHKSKKKEFARLKCERMSKQEFQKASPWCKNFRLNTSFAINLDKKELQKTYKQMKKHYPNTARWMKPLLGKNLYIELLKSPKDIYLRYYNYGGEKIRHKTLNHDINASFLNDLAKHEKHFDRFIYLSVVEQKADKILKSLLKVNPKNKHLKERAIFYLGINALKLKNKNLANEFFIQAEKKSYYTINKNKALFWSYLVTKDKKYLKKLANSYEFNIYSGYAKELLKQKPHDLISYNFDKNTTKYDIHNPFLWTNALNKIADKNATKIKKLLKTFQYQNTLPHFAFLSERLDFKKNYFITPYKDEFAKYDVKRQILMLSIARQESRFIPASISTSYALGMMQFMPFVAKEVAKQEKMQNFDLDDMFEVKTALKVANNHLNWLSKNVYHPLFIAYSYNAGLGYTQRNITQKKLFTKDEFEPFLSMEMISYSESREYGKKVLANYVAYSRIYDEEISFHELFEDLKIPEKSYKLKNEK